MSCHPHCPTATVYDPPVQVVNDIYDPQLVNVVHTVEVVNSHHCVPVYQHCYQYVVKEEFNGPVNPVNGVNGGLNGGYGREVRTSGLRKKSKAAAKAKAKIKSKSSK